jgi:hypothetical protein
MTCPTAFTIADGTTTASVPVAAVSETFRISRRLDDEGLATFTAASGAAWVDVRFVAWIYTIDGAGPASPGFSALSMTAASWTVVIPGFANGSASETWTVVPAMPEHSRDRRTGIHSWTLTLRATAAS